MKKCEHDLAERESDCADGACPICSRVKANRLEATLVMVLTEMVGLEGHGTGHHHHQCMPCAAIAAANNLLAVYR